MQALEGRIGLGDIDKDGDLDALTAYSGVPNILWLNDGSANFTNIGQLIGNSGSEDVGLGDLDNDGDLDAFIANDNANKIWLNTLSDPLIGDLNGDCQVNLLDLALMAENWLKKQ